jgi:GDP-L-fucose synthase
MLDLTSKRITVTGGAGFLGAHIVEQLRARGCGDIFVPRRRQYDLTRGEAVERLFERHSPEVLIHCAAVVGGIGANRENPGLFFYENASMGLHLIEAARRYGTAKVVVLGTICAYPKFTPVPFQEKDLWNGYPEETNAPYGIAKKALLVQCQAYREQYGLNAIYLLPVNLYGPHDNFDLQSSHVIPALIRKCVEAVEQGASELVCWGDGSPSREFLYVEDAARGIVAATEQYDEPGPVNLGSGREVLIKDLVEMVASLTGFKGRIVWDTTKPNGQPRRCLDVSRAQQRFGFKAGTDLEEGLRRTVDWYLSSRGHDLMQTSSAHSQAVTSR